MEHLYASMWQWVQAYGVHGVLLFMAAENVGVPLPTALGFLTAQGLVESHAITYWQAFLWIAAGHLIGAGASYHAGRATDSALGRYLSHRRGLMKACEKLQGWYDRYGALTLLFGRLEGHVRPWASFVAGLSRVEPLSFWLWTVVGTAIYTVVTMWVTAVGWKFWLAHAEWRAPIIIVILLAFYAVPGYKLVEHLVRRHRRLKAHVTSE
jgi:membrane protein DedA with SNARE-associated domain